MATKPLLKTLSPISTSLTLISDANASELHRSPAFHVNIPFKWHSVLFKVAIAAQLLTVLRLCHCWHRRRMARIADLRRRCIQKKQKEAKDQIRREMMEMYWGTLKKIEDLKNTPSCLMTDWQKQVSQTRSIEHGKKMIKVMQEDLKVQLEFIERWYDWQHSEKELRQVLVGNSHLLQAVWD